MSRWLGRPRIHDVVILCDRADSASCDSGFKMSGGSGRIALRSQPDSNRKACCF